MSTEGMCKLHNFYRSPQDSFVKFLEKGLKKRHKYAMMQK